MDDEELTDYEKRLAAAAAELEKDMDIEPGPEVKVRVSKPVRHVFSLKIGADELDQIADAAEAADVSVGAFIRSAALEKARAVGPARELDLDTELAQMSQQLSSLADRIHVLRLRGLDGAREKRRTRSRR
jgi:hypothetical protein